MQADPFDTLHFYKGTQQICQLALFVQVQTVIGQILRDKNEFLGSFRSKLFSLRDQFFYRRTAVLSSHQWNSTETTRAITALSNLQIRKVLWRCSHTLTYQLVLIICTQYLEQLRHITRPEVGIYIRNLLFKVRLVTLRQTTCYIHLLYLTTLFLICIVQDGIDALLFGIVNEATRIDHYNIVLILFWGFVHHLFAVGFELAHQYLTVVDVLRTPEGHNIDLVLTSGACTHLFLE